MKDYNILNFADQFYENKEFGLRNIECKNLLSRLKPYLTTDQYNVYVEKRDWGTKDGLDTIKNQLEATYNNIINEKDNWGNEELQKYLKHYKSIYIARNDEDIKRDYQYDAGKALKHLKIFYYQDKLDKDFGFTNISPLIQSDDIVEQGKNLEDKYKKIDSKIKEIEKNIAIINSLELYNQKIRRDRVLQDENDQNTNTSTNTKKKKILHFKMLLKNIKVMLMKHKYF